MLLFSVQTDRIVWEPSHIHRRLGLSPVHSAITFCTLRLFSHCGCSVNCDVPVRVLTVGISALRAWKRHGPWIYLALVLFNPLANSVSLSKLLWLITHIMETAEVPNCGNLGHCTLTSFHGSEWLTYSFDLGLAPWRVFSGYWAWVTEVWPATGLWTWHVCHRPGENVEEVTSKTKEKRKADAEAELRNPGWVGARPADFRPVWQASQGQPSPNTRRLQKCLLLCANAMQWEPVTYNHCGHG